MKGYTEKFFSHKQNAKRKAAIRVLRLVQSRQPHIQSIIDVGCGIGIWLDAAYELGIEDLLGLDGDWLDPKQLLIPEGNFKKVDLSKPFEISRSFDLAVSLEVAEHLPEQSAEGFVDQLTSLSTCVLFSAAIPGQGGVHHVNEQWPSYWVQLFEKNGFKLDDSIRPKIWKDSEFPSYYRQNILLFRRLGPDDEAGHSTSEGLLDVVHPEMLAGKLSPGIKKSARLLINAILRRLKG